MAGVHHLWFDLFLARKKKNVNEILRVKSLSQPVQNEALIAPRKCSIMYK